MVKVENLSKEFIMHIRNDAQIEGFEGIYLEVEAGTLTAVTGPSGCGKSSLLLLSIVPTVLLFNLLSCGVKTAKSRNTIHAVLPLLASRNRHCWTYWPILRTK